LSSDFNTCGSCLREPPPFTSTLCATDYQFPWDRLIAAFKFQNQPELAAPLAACMQAAVHLWQQALPGAPMPQILLPVPLSAARLAQRGYNQAW
jgi:predicted amidophosphoribosyltransferase